MKTLLFFAGMLIATLHALPDDLTLASDNRTPYDRCMSQFEGSDHVDQCFVLYYGE